MNNTLKSLLFSCTLMLSGFFQTQSQNLEMTHQETFSEIRWFDTIDLEKKAIMDAWLKLAANPSNMDIQEYSYYKLDSTERWEDCDVIIMDTYILSDKWETAITENKNQPLVPLLQLDKTKVRLFICKNQKIILFLELLKFSDQWRWNHTNILFKYAADEIGDYIFNKKRQFHVLIKNKSKRYFWVENGVLMTMKSSNNAFKPLKLRDVFLDEIKAKNERININERNTGGDFPDHEIH